MKGPVLPAVSLSALVALSSACASASRPPEMPAWTPAVVDTLPASARADDQDEVRVPRDSEPNTVRVPRDVEPPKIWPASGLYLGGAILSAQPMDDFDGGLHYVLSGTPSEELIVPDLDVGAGAGIYLSYRWHMDEVLVQYSITEHDGEGTDLMGANRDIDATFHDLEITWRHYFLEKSPLQPYLLGSLLLDGKVELENGSTNSGTGEPVDAELEDGVGGALGAGAALYTLPWVVFYGQASWRFMRYTRGDGFPGEFPLTPDTDADGWQVSFGAAVRLFPARR